MRCTHTQAPCCLLLVAGVLAQRVFTGPCLQALFDLEATNVELKADLRDLYITSAKEVDVASGGRKAIIIHVSSQPRSRRLISCPWRMMAWGVSKLPWACAEEQGESRKRC